MGMNYFLCFKDPMYKSSIDAGQVKYFKNSDIFEIVDYPDFHYSVHFCKISIGWKPLFQAHQNINSFQEYIKLLDRDDIYILNENADPIDKTEFINRLKEKNLNEEYLSHFHECNDGFISSDGFDFCSSYFS